MLRQLDVACTVQGNGQTTETVFVRIGLLQGVALAAICWVFIKLFSKLFWRKLDAISNVGLEKVSWSAPLPSSLSGHDGHAADTNAKLCWDKEYGRYKYCGLRKDPYASNDVPRYSLDPLDIKLPDLDCAEKDQLLALKERVVDLADGRHRVDLATCLRFLRARAGNIKEAEELLREAAALRKKHELDEMFTHWDLEAYEQCLAPWWLSGGFCGHGLQGEPVAIERIGKCNWPRLVATLPWDVVMKLDFVHCQRALAALEEDALSRNVPLRPATLVFDLDGFGFDQIQFRGAMKLRHLTDVRNLLLTETTGNIIMVRAPKAFVKAWSLFKHLLDPGTVKKVKVVTAEDTFKQLCEYIDKKEIPAYLGGSRCDDGDPECRRILAPGGFPPQEAFDRLQALIARGKKRLQNGASSKALAGATSDSNATVPCDLQDAGATYMCGLKSERACCVIS